MLDTLTETQHVGEIVLYNKNDEQSGKPFLHLRTLRIVIESVRQAAV